MEWVRALLHGLRGLVDLAFNIYMFMLVIRILMTWFQPNPFHPAVRLLRRATDPLLDAVRRWVPLQTGLIDFSPVILFLALTLVQKTLMSLLALLEQSL